MKYRLCFLLMLLFMLCGTCFVQAASITATTDTVTVLDASENTTLLVGLYHKNTLVNIATYQGGKTITGNFSQDMADSISQATDIKAFLWNLETLTPLCNAFSSKLIDLPEAEKTLVVYYSRSNNTKMLAETVHKITGGDIVRIEPVQAYPEDYSECLAQVQEEQATDYRPPITIDLESIDQYNTILIGYPIWYNSLPTPVVTFLANYDFSGQTMIPFCTSGSSGIGDSISMIKSLCPNSTVTNGFRGTANSSVSQVTNWLSQNRFSK